MSGYKSGDRCAWVKHPEGKPYPAVEHRYCDDHPDGTIRDEVTNKTLKRSPVGAPRGNR